MSRLTVLITTMFQKNTKKYFEMNLHTDAIIANQGNENNINKSVIDGNNVLFISKVERGLSKNRNTALKNISDDPEFIIFADDDIIFYNNYEDEIVSEFEKHPEVDAIKFNIRCISSRQLSMKPIIKFHRATRREVTCFGIWGTAFKYDKFKKLNLCFNERFGAGTENYCGEDTIFYQNLFKKKVKLYCSPKYIADIDEEESTWFNGYDDKYFKVAGMVLNECYPLLSYFLVIRSAYKFSKRKKCEIEFYKILGGYYKGILENKHVKKNMKREGRDGNKN